VVLHDSRVPPHGGPPSRARSVQPPPPARVPRACPGRFPHAAVVCCSVWARLDGGSDVHVPGLRFDPMALLHGEQEVYLPAALPTAATAVTRGRVTNVFDKGKGAAVVFEAVSTDLNTGATLAVNRSTLFIRGIGGFGGDRGSGSGDDASARWARTAPQAVFHATTTANQVR